MYPRIVRQIAPIGETAFSSAVEAVSDCCQFIWEFTGWQLRWAPECCRCPCNAAAPPEYARCHPLADSSPRLPPRCARLPERSRLTCPQIQFYSCLRDGSEYSPAAPENSRNSSTKKFREIDSAPAARPRDRRF